MNTVFGLSFLAGIGFAVKKAYDKQKVIDAASEVICHTDIPGKTYYYRDPKQVTTTRYSQISKIHREMGSEGIPRDVLTFTDGTRSHLYGSGHTISDLKEYHDRDYYNLK